MSWIKDIKKYEKYSIEELTKRMKEIEQNKVTKNWEHKVKLIVNTIKYKMSNGSVHENY